MEIRTKFNLENSVGIWRKELSENSSMTPDNVNELESHLLEEITELQKLGLSPYECFLIATKRIGDIQELTTEFGKINKKEYFRNKIAPYLKGILVFLVFITATDLITSFSVLIANKFGVNNLNIISIGLLIFLTISLTIFSYIKYADKNYNFKKLTNIPILVGSIVVSKILYFFTVSDLSRTIGLENFVDLQFNLSLYKLVFSFLIIVISCIIFNSIKKENKLKVVE